MKHAQRDWSEPRARAPGPELACVGSQSRQNWAWLHSFLTSRRGVAWKGVPENIQWDSNLYLAEGTRYLIVYSGQNTLN